MGRVSRLGQDECSGSSIFQVWSGVHEDADEFVVELFEDPELYGIGYEEYNMFFL